MRTLLLAVLLFSGCGFSGFEPTKAYWPAAIQSWYSITWDQVKPCVAKIRPIRKEFKDIDWFVVSGSEFLTDAGMGAGAYSKGRIYLAETHAKNPHSVRHEAIHAMTDTYDHPEELFGPEGCVFTTG